MVAAGALSGGISAWRVARVPSTEALEQDLLVSWRRELPQDATVHYLGRAGRRVFYVPLYGVAPARPPVILKTGEAIPNAGDRAPAYFYRSSLCETDEGAPICEAVGKEWKTTVVKTATLPSRPSHPLVRYRRAVVDVVLSRVE